MNQIPPDCPLLLYVTNRNPALCAIKRTPLSRRKPGTLDRAVPIYRHNRTQNLRGFKR